MTNKEEGNSEMGWGKFNCGHVNCSSCPNYSMKCERKSSLSSTIESLPDELVFDILLLLSARDIYNGPMFVCKKWYDMVRTRKFISAHVHRSTPGLLIQNVNDRKQPVFVEMRQGQIYMSNLNYESGGRVWASCNGLVLESGFNDTGALYIVNPVIKQRFALPPFACQEGFCCYSNMAYAEVSKQYKVVLMYCRMYDPSIIRKSAILTVGVDKSWREFRIKRSYSSATSTTDGFIHWHKGTRVLTLNAETEIIRETEITKETPMTDGYGKRLDRYYSSTGNSLTLFVACSEFSWEVLMMKSETGEWTKVAKIDLEGRVFEFKHLVPQSRCYAAVHHPRLRPVGWFNYPEVLVLCVYSSGVCILYYVGTQEIDYLELDHPSGYQSFVSHRNIA